MLKALKARKALKDHNQAFICVLQNGCSEKIDLYLTKQL